MRECEGLAPSFDRFRGDEHVPQRGRATLVTPPRRGLHRDRLELREPLISGRYLRPNLVLHGGGRESDSVGDRHREDAVLVGPGEERGGESVVHALNGTAHSRSHGGTIRA